MKIHKTWISQNREGIKTIYETNLAMFSLLKGMFNQKDQFQLLDVANEFITQMQPSRKFQDHLLAIVAIYHQKNSKTYLAYIDDVFEKQRTLN